MKQTKLEFRNVIDGRNGQPRSAVYARMFFFFTWNASCPHSRLFHLLYLTEAARLLLITDSRKTVKLERFIVIGKLGDSRRENTWLKTIWREIGRYEYDKLAWPPLLAGIFVKLYNTDALFSTAWISREQLFLSAIYNCNLMDV